MNNLQKDIPFWLVDSSVDYVFGAANTANEFFENLACLSKEADAGRDIYDRVCSLRWPLVDIRRLALTSQIVDKEGESLYEIMAEILDMIDDLLADYRECTYDADFESWRDIEENAP